MGVPLQRRSADLRWVLCEEIRNEVDKSWFWTDSNLCNDLTKVGFEKNGVMHRGVVETYTGPSAWVKVRAIPSSINPAQDSDHDPTILLTRFLLNS